MLTEKTQALSVARASAPPLVPMTATRTVMGLSTRTPGRD
jgi:hypothetical protein